MGRTALERILPRVPLVDVTFPEDRSIESVAGDQPPGGRQLDRRSRPFVQNVEQPAAGGHARSHAGHVIVMAGPAGAADPTQLRGRADHVVLRHGIAVGIVKVMCPLVHLRRPRLAQGFRFQVSGFRRDLQQYTPGRQHPHQLLISYPGFCILHHDQVHQIVGVWQRLSVPQVDADGAVAALCLQALARGCDFCFRSAESMNDVLVPDT